MLRMFIPITRVHEEGGSVFVEGYATRDAVDDRGTAFDFDGGTEAFTEWTDKFQRLTDGESMGNIREMHGKVAAGRCVGWRPDEKEKGHYICAEVVDDAAAKKCQKRVYTGFSIGADPLEPPRMEKRGTRMVPVYHKFRIVEVSLVDHGSTPGTEFTVVRRADPAAAAIVAPAEEPAAPEATAAAPEAVTPAAAAAPPATVPPSAPTEAPAMPTVAPVLATQAPVLATQTPSPAPLSRVAVSLRFDAKKFMPGTAVNWARAHDFLVRAVPEVAPNATHFEIEQRAVKDFSDIEAVSLGEGVELLSGHLKTDSAAARFGEILRLVEPEILRAAQSQEYTILPSLTALAALCQAISSCMYSSSSDLPESSKADVASLTTAAESILDFIGSRLGEQLSSLTSGAERLAQGELERFTQLPQVLSRGQLERLMGQDEMKGNVATMHDLGHALCDATMKMGGACSAGACLAGETEQERLARATPPPIQRAGFPSPQEVGQRHSTGARTPAPARTPAAAAAAPAAAPIERVSSPTGNDQVLQTLGEVAEQVKGLATRIASIDERVAQVASLPGPIGRAPAAPVSKTLAGTDPPADRVTVSGELQRMAETMTDPALKTQLVLRAAALLAPGASPAGQGTRT